MKRFRCTVTRRDEYVIELDETKLTPEWMAEFAKTMYPFYKLEQHAQHLAQHRSRFPESGFVEGYGYVPVNGTLPYNHHAELVAPGLNIEVVSEDADLDVDVREVT